MKFALGEPERAALQAEVARWTGLVSSTLLIVEAVRACARYGRSYADRARDDLAGVNIVPIDDAVVDAAARLEPARLRSLDAIHVATALSLGDDVGAFIAYDDRLLRAAAEHGLPTLKPA